MCTLDGSSSAALVYASSASLVWLLQDSYCSMLVSCASNEFFLSQEQLTKVPRSYQTSEMLGLSRMARE
jgi:hypothetical protein